MRRSRLTVMAVLVAALVLPGRPAAATPSPPAEAAQFPVVLLYDVNAGRKLVAVQEDLRFVPASMTKAMTAYTAFNLMAAGKLRPEQRYTVDPLTAGRWQGSGATMNLRGGEAVSVDMLLRGLTTVSANDAAVVLAEGYAGDVATWCALMNADARRLGLADSRFENPNGWPDGGRTYTSAMDLARLGTALVYRHPGLYRRYFGQRTIDWPRASGRNHDPVTGIVPGADGIKTGHTREAGYNFLGSAERDGRRLMLVLAGGRSAEQRAGAARALLEWGFSAWQSRPLFPSGGIVARARVQGGATRTVGLSAPFPVRFTSPRGAPAAPRLSLVYRGPLIAPLRKGQQVAELQIADGAEVVGRIPLHTVQDVARAGIFDRLVNGLAGLVS